MPTVPCANSILRNKYNPILWCASVTSAFLPTQLLHKGMCKNGTYKSPYLASLYIEEREKMDGFAGNTKEKMELRLLTNVSLSYRTRLEHQSTRRRTDVTPWVWGWCLRRTWPQRSTTLTGCCRESASPSTPTEI